MTDISDNADNPASTADRRTFLKTAGLAGAAGALAGAAHGKFSLAPVSSAQAQTPPAAAGAKLSADKWWPSKWGATDEAGASNHITPAKVLDAVKLIRDGKVYRLGRVYEYGMPLFGQRAFTLRIPVERAPDGALPRFELKARRWVTEEIRANNA